MLHTSSTSRSPRVVTCSRKAMQQGVRSEMPLAEAQSLVRRGRFLEQDAGADRLGLQQLAWECQQFTPRAGMDESDEPDCLFLDVSGCEHLYQDVRELCDSISRHFRLRKYFVRGACAPTWGAAYCLARHTALRDPFEIASADELPSRLSAAPLEGLRLPQKTLTIMAECGLERIGQLLELPRSSLPSRFGPQLLRRLDQSLGVVEELLTPEFPPQLCLIRQRWEFPLHEMEAIDLALQQLLQQVVTELHRRQALTQEIRVKWTMDTGESPTVRVRLLKPTTSQVKLWELLSLRRERLSLIGGVSCIEIEATPTRSDVVRRTTLFEQGDSREAELTHLIERLSLRLGEESVLRYWLLPEAQPELALVGEPWLTQENREALHPRPTTSGSDACLQAPTLPLRLFSPPEPITGRGSESAPLTRFRWRGREYRVTLCSWPERIETGWWRTRSVHRDYYRIETDDGMRLWVFRDRGSLQWSLHGLFE